MVALTRVAKSLHQISRAN